MDTIDMFLNIILTLDVTQTQTLGVANYDCVGEITHFEMEFVKFWWVDHTKYAYHKRIISPLLIMKLIFRQHWRWLRCPRKWNLLMFGPFWDYKFAHFFPLPFFSIRKQPPNLTYLGPHFTNETESPWLLNFKHSHWWKRQSRSKFATSHCAWGTTGVYMWMQDGCKVYMDSYMASNGSCFMVTWTTFKNHLLEVGLTQNRETMALRMLTTNDFFLFSFSFSCSFLSCVRTHMNKNSLK